MCPWFYLEKRAAATLHRHGATDVQNWNPAVCKTNAMAKLQQKRVLHHGRW
jgi:hypothetical protein